MNDLQLNETLDLQVTSGDFLTAESTVQHQRLLLIAHAGDFRQYPRVGVGLESYLNDEKDDIRVEIRSQFEKDGMSVSSLRLNGSKIEIEAEYR